MDVVDERSIPHDHSPPSDEKWLWDSSGWQLDVDGEMLLGYDLSKRSASDLLQNCDLPPPVKLIFPLEDHGGCDNSHRAAAEERKINVEVADQWDGQLGPAESTRLLRALRLSQTRAREAERKAAEESRQRQELSKLLLEEALRLSSYRRWAMLLEAEISVLRKQGLVLQPREDKEEEEEEEEEEVAAAAAAWWLTLALCIGIAGVGFVMGRFMLD